MIMSRYDNDNNDNVCTNAGNYAWNVVESE
jgi:hypothetical protein